MARRPRRPYTGETVEPLMAELRRTRAVTSWQVCPRCLHAYHKVGASCPICARRVPGVEARPVVVTILPGYTMPRRSDV